MDRESYNQTQPTYMPDARQALTQFGHLKRAIPLVAHDTPDDVCGTAHRVGYTSIAEGQQALYRLKLCKAGRKGSTIPGFFTLANGVFVEYVPSSTCLQQHEE